METARIAQIIDEMGTLLEIEGENPFRCPGLSHGGPGAGQLARRPVGDDRRRQLERGARHRRHDVRQDRAARHDRAVARPTTSCGGARRRAWSRSCGSRAWARRRSRRCTTSSRSRAWPTCATAAESGQIAGSRALATRPRPRSSRGSRSSRSRASGSSRAMRLRLVAPILEAVRGHPAGDPRRGLRQPAPPGRDDRRPGYPVQLEASRRGARRVRQAAPGRDGAGPRADQGERPAGRRRAVRPAGGRRRPVPVRAALLHRLEGAQHRDAQAGAGPRALAERICPRRADGRRSPAGPRPSSSRRSGWPRSRPSCARMPARSRPPRRAGSPTWSSSPT